MPVGGNALYLASKANNSKQSLAEHFKINTDVYYKEGFKFQNKHLSFSDLSKLIDADKFLNVNADWTPE